MLVTAYVLAIPPKRRRAFLRAVDVVIDRHVHDPAAFDLGRPDSDKPAMDEARGPAITWVRMLRRRLDTLPLLD